MYIRQFIRQSWTYIGKENDPPRCSPIKNIPGITICPAKVKKQRKWKLVSVFSKQTLV